MQLLGSKHFCSGKRTVNPDIQIRLRTEKKHHDAKKITYRVRTTMSYDKLRVGTAVVYRVQTSAGIPDIHTRIPDIQSAQVRVYW